MASVGDISFSNLVSQCQKLFSDLKDSWRTLLTKDNAKLVGTSLLTVYGYYIFCKYCVLAGRSLWKLYTTKAYSDQVKQNTLSQTFGDCRNNWAVITGCTSGIGLEMAKILSLCHFNLLLISRDEQ